MPRPYRLGQRQETSDQTSARIIDAARILLGARTAAAFTVDAGSRGAGVTRAPIHARFESKGGLLVALSDRLAERGGMALLSEAFQRPEPQEALNQFIAVFGCFWSANREGAGRLRATASLDPAISRVIGARDERRRRGLRVLVQRLVSTGYGPPSESTEGVGAVLQTLTSFETFDGLAGAGRAFKEVTPLVQRLARAVLRW